MPETTIEELVNTLPFTQEKISAYDKNRKRAYKTAPVGNDMIQYHFNVLI